MAAKGKAQVYLQWTESDKLSEVKSAQLQRKTGTAGWKNAGVPGDSSARVFLKAGQNNKFRVKAKDPSATSAQRGIPGRLVRDSGSSQWGQTGAWKTKKAKKAFRGSMLIASAASPVKTRLTARPRPSRPRSGPAEASSACAWTAAHGRPSIPSRRQPVTARSSGQSTPVR